MKKLKKIAKDFSESCTPEKKKKSKINPKDLVPTGSTTFNLECSGHVDGAFKLGKIVNLIGDSHSGKSLFCLTLLAECANNERFDDYRFIYDDVEAANEFDIGELFGEAAEERIELVTDSENFPSSTIEEFTDNFAAAIEDGRPFIYILDSNDALTSEAEIDKSDENRKKRLKGNETKGSYGDGKPKALSEFFRINKRHLDDKKSVLIIVSQTRDNLGFGAQFNPKVRSGGKALKFYSFHEVWLACQQKEKKGKRTLVTNVQAKITKNKLTGRHGETYFPVLFDYGIDDITSCINFLIEEKTWSGSGKEINTKGFMPLPEVPEGKSKKKPKAGFSMKEIVKYVEHTDGARDRLRQLCQECYDNVIAGMKPERVKKY